MGNLIWKVNQDPAEDRYCVWSTIVEAPVFDGTRAEIERYQLFWNGEKVRPRLDEWFARANEKGSSLDWDGDWGDKVIYEQRGLLPREKLGDLLDALASTPPDLDAAWDLLEPFEDRDEVFRG